VCVLSSLLFSSRWKFIFNSRYPDSGGAFKIQIYSQYMIINKTSLPFYVKSARSALASLPQEVAGETDMGGFPLDASLTLSNLVCQAFCLSRPHSVRAGIFYDEYHLTKFFSVMPSK
jgi:SHR-binding domain of vacuolar-sorting associated protein 13